MDKQYITRIVLHPSFHATIYSESEVVEASHLKPGTIRHLHMRGLIQGQKADGQQRYSHAEVARLRQIQRLQRDLGVNLAGVEVILHLLEHVAALQQELEQERQNHEH